LPSGKGEEHVTSPQEPKLSADLLAFLDADPPASDVPLARVDLFVEEQVQGETKSRFIAEGGVCFNNVGSYELGPADLHPMASQRRGFADVRLELLKFQFTIDALPPSRQYESVSVRVTLQPLVTVRMLKPRLETTETSTEATSGTAAGLDVARLIQLVLAENGGKATRPAQQAPTVTALDLGARGFGWNFEAREGAPLSPRLVYTEAMIEVPRGTTTLAGLFDAHARIRRPKMRSFTTRPAGPVDSAAPFTLDLTRPSLRPQP
jgi:hypothetical protein